MTQSVSLQLEELLTQMGEAGLLLREMGACEGAAGNISICAREPLPDMREIFSKEEQIHLPLSVPEIPGVTFLVSGSGCRLRDILSEPTANVGCLVVNEDGLTGQLFTASDRQFTRLTSEFNSHLAVHRDQMAEGNLNFHAVVHAQPPYTTYLSHIDRYQDETYFNRHLLRWEPETILQFPQGLGMVKYQMPSSADMAIATAESLRKHTFSVWARHGVMTRSEISLMNACDRVEYAETAARYEYLNLTTGEQSSGLSADEIHALCDNFNVHQEIF